MLRDYEEIEAVGAGGAAAIFHHCDGRDTASRKMKLAEQSEHNENLFQSCQRAISTMRTL
jgi:hypothetical protein